MRKFKIVIYFLFVFTSFNLQSQIFQGLIQIKDHGMEFDTIEINFGKWETKYSNEKKLLEINKLNKFESFNLSKKIKDYRFIDFNQDGLIDIVFRGFTSGESIVTIFFRRTPEGYDFVQEFYGSIYKVSDYSTSRQFSFSFVSMGCCAAVVNQFYYYNSFIDDKSGKISFSAGEKLSYYVDTKFPPIFYDKNKFFKTINDKYFLRAQPFIDDTTMRAWEFAETALMKGNIIAVYPQNSHGFALADEIDKTGRKWYFVMMMNNKKPIETTLYPENENFKSCGWVSSNFVEMVED